MVFEDRCANSGSNLPSWLIPNNQEKKSWWNLAVENYNEKVVNSILESSSPLEVLMLARVLGPDAKSRVIDAAPEACVSAIERHLTLFDKYSLIPETEPKSDGDIITLHAIDKWMWLSVNDQMQKENCPDEANGDAVEVTMIKPGKNNEVILRFYRYEEAFLAELKLREKYDLQAKFIEILLNHNQGHKLYSCISFETPDHDLELVFNKTVHGTRSPKWFRKSKIVLRQIVIALKHLHEKGFVHGHLIPKNVAKYGMNWKLTNICLLTKFGVPMRGPLRVCIPPEAVRERIRSVHPNPKPTLVSFDTVFASSPEKYTKSKVIQESRDDMNSKADALPVRDMRIPSEKKKSDSAKNLIIDTTRTSKIEVLDKTFHSPHKYSLLEFCPHRISAGPEWDAWGLGLIMFQLLVGRSLNLPNFEKADDALMKNLYTFKKHNLKKLYRQIIQVVGDVDAADLVVRLLNPDPRHRASRMGKVLRHKYFVISGSREIIMNP